MLYLEDYLEMIENLPMEMRDRFTDMREVDLQVQNAMDSLDERVKTFFKKCSTPATKQENADEHFSKIKTDYYKALEDADEKVQLANQMYDVVDRHLRKLDQELAKFKMELEADNAGITEVLEKRSLELDVPPQSANNHRAEKRKYTHQALTNHLDKRAATTDKVLSNIAQDAVKETLKTTAPPPTTTTTPTTTSSSYESTNSLSTAISYNIGRIGSGSNAAIAAAASQAIAATQQMQQGRRTASLKASYEVLSKGSELSKEFTIGGVTYTSAATATAAAAAAAAAATVGSLDGAVRTPRSKKQTPKAQQAQPAPTPAAPEPTPPAEEFPATEQLLDENGQPVDWNYDPNEPRYCICNQVSYGDMVGCDNEDCPIEWFHYGCVGLTQAPKGKWYCPQCTAAMKRRGRK